MATLAQDKDTLLKWALGLLVSANIGAILWVGNLAIDLQNKLMVKDAIDNAEIKSIHKELARVSAAFDAFKSDQKNRDDEQDEFREAILIRDDKYWEQKKRTEKNPYQ